jgi:phosphopantetheine adenylyltransferase
MVATADTAPAVAAANAARAKNGTAPLDALIVEQIVTQEIPGGAPASAKVSSSAIPASAFWALAFNRHPSPPLAHPYPSLP